MAIETNTNNNDPTQQTQTETETETETKTSHHIDQNTTAAEAMAVEWGTWEELLLACAVKRHGFTNWDTVSMEVQSKCSLPHSLTTPHHCQVKYHDLHRRFSEPLPEPPPPQPHRTNTNHHDSVESKSREGEEEQAAAEEEEEEIMENGVVTWIEELRKIRVDELRREVERHDSSILSLQLKVKKLEEEKEASSQQERQSEQSGPDLERRCGEEETERSGSENQINISSIKIDDRLEPDRSSPDYENRSVNESNSTGGKVKADPESAAPAVPAEEEGLGRGGEEESNEAGGDDSVTQVSGEVQSSASLGGKRKRKERSRRFMDGGGGGVSAAAAVKREVGVEVVVRPEPLIKVLDMIRAHQHGSFFEGRLESQETEDYKNIVKQHLDLETIQTRMEQGSYTCSPSSSSFLNLAFCRDLLLLFNNAIVFFPKSSPESLAAMELRSLVMKEMKKEMQKSDSGTAQHGTMSQPKSEEERSDSLLAKHKSAVPLIVCRKRSSMTKPSSSTKTEQQQESNDSKPTDDQKPAIVEDSLLKINTQDRPVTGTRSSRRNTKKPAAETSNNNPIKKQNTSSGTKASVADKPETTKTETKTDSLTSDKKRSAADFLKRIKKNSPVDPVKKSNTRGGGGGAGEEKKEASKKVEKGKEKTSTKPNLRKQAEEDHNPSSRRNAGSSTTKKAAETSRGSAKRGRESSVKEAPKRPRKRSRR